MITTSDVFFSCDPTLCLAVSEVKNVKVCVCVEEDILVRPEAPGLLLSKGDGN